MKKIIYTLFLAFSLTACSLNDVVALLVPPTPLPANQSTPTATIVTTPSKIPTITATLPTPTFTGTPTMIGYVAPIPTEEGQPTLTPLPTLTPVPQTNFLDSNGGLLTSLAVSNDVLYWGYCDSLHYVDFDVRLSSTVHVAYVLLFMRLVDKGGNQSTPWGGGAIMEEAGGSFYTYRVTPEKLSHYDEFKDAWIEYQVVASTGSLKTLDRTPVYTTSLSLEWCQPNVLVP